jgi:hypothetical protein
MTDKEFQEVLDHLRDHVLNSSYAQLDEVIATETRNFPTAGERLLGYMNMLIAMVKERSGGTYSKIMQNLVQSIELENSQAFQGVDVALSEAETNAFKIDGFSLVELDDVSRFSSALEKIAKIIRNELPPPTSPMTMKVS